MTLALALAVAGLVAAVAQKRAEAALVPVAVAPRLAT